jgi:hypothetical protein
LTWQAPASNGGSSIIGYKVYRATAEGAVYSLVASTSSMSFADSNVTAGQSYWYKVSAVTAAGEGTQGPAFSASVTKAGPTSNNTLLIVVAVVVIALVLVVVVVMVKRRGVKKRGAPSYPPLQGAVDPMGPAVENANQAPPQAQAYSYCPSCGAQNHGSEVCRNCGKKVR